MVSVDRVARATLELVAGVASRDVRPDDRRRRHRATSSGTAAVAADSAVQDAYMGGKKFHTEVFAHSRQ